MERSLSVTQPRSKLIALQKVAGTKAISFVDADVVFDDFLDAAVLKDTDVFADALIGIMDTADADWAVATDLVTVTAHTFVTGDKVRITNAGGALPTCNPAIVSGVTDVFVNVVDENTIKLYDTAEHAIAGAALGLIDIQAAAGGGVHTITNSTVTFAAAHGLTTADAVNVTNAGGALPTGLVAGTQYYAIVISATRLAFAASAVDAAADTRVQITAAAGGGVHTMHYCTDGVTMTAHPFLTEDKVRLTSTGTLPTGLSAGTDYWIIKVDANTVKFASSLANAQAGTAVNILKATSGGTHRVCSSVIKETAHGFITGDRVALTTTGALPTGLSATMYWVIKLTDDKFALASTLANSANDTRVQITLPAGGGTHTATMTDKLAGFDSYQAHTLQVQALGIYRITFAQAFAHTNYIVAATSTTVDQVPFILTRNAAYVDIKINEIDETDAFVNGNFDIMILGSEQSDLY